MKKKTVITGILAALAAMTLLTACGKKEETSLPEEAVTEEENMEEEAVEEAEAEEEAQADGVDMNWFLNEENWVKVSFKELIEADGGEFTDEDIYFYIPYLDGVTENGNTLKICNTNIEEGEEFSQLYTSMSWSEGDEVDLKKAYNTGDGEYSTIEIGEKYVLQYPSGGIFAKRATIVNRQNMNVFQLTFKTDGQEKDIRFEARDLFVEKLIQALEEQL